MINKKKLFISILIVLSVFICLTSVAAQDTTDANLTQDFADEVSQAGGDDVHIELAEIDDDSKASQEDNQPIGQSNSEDIISEPDDGSFEALESKIDNAPDNSIIKLENDYLYSGSGKGHGIEIRKPLTIDGQGKTIDANQKVRVFYIVSENVILKNIIFINGNWGSTNNGGGDIYSRGYNTLIYNCTFMNNKASNDGGAVYLTGDNGVVSNCSFVNSTASEQAGAVYVSGDNGVVSNSSFVNSSARHEGGAVYLKGDNGVVSNCSFVNSSSTSYEGGAVYLYSQNGVVSNCSFVNSSAKKDGGAVFLKGKNAALSNCSFVNSSSTSHEGGAVFWSSADGVVSNCSFVNSSAKMKGGTVYWEGTKGIVSNCSFVNSSASDDGGTVYWYASGGTVSGCSFVNSTSADDQGGAIYFNGNKGAVSGCSFVNCSSQSGGAVYWRGDDGIVSDCSFVNNNASDNGGAVNCHGPDSIVSDCSFVNNSAGNEGGAVFWYNTRGTLSGCSFVNNNASDDGGAVYWQGYNGAFSGCSFMNNSAGNNGGALYWVRNNGDLSACSFVNSSAGNDGGAVYWSGNNGKVSNCSFMHSSGIYGGAIYLIDTNSSVYTCIFVNNTADIGIIHFENVNQENISHFKINNNIFLNNAGGREISFNQIDNNSNADYNWFGNNATNYDMAPATNDMEISAWLFLNATANPDIINISNVSEVVFKLYAYTPSGVSEYDNSLLKAVNLTLTPTKGRVNTTRVGLEEPVQYTAESRGIGKITATIENVSYTRLVIVPKNNITSIKASSLTTRVGTNATVNVVLAEKDANGTVTITINGVKYVGDVKNGQGTIVLPLLPAGKTKHTVIYRGDDNYNSKTTTVNVNVNKYYPTIKATARTVHVGDDVVINVTRLPELATGTVSVNIGGAVYNATVEDGSAVIVVPDLPLGNYTLDVSYSGDEMYKAYNTTVTFNVNKLITIMQCPTRTVHVGDDVTINVKLADDATGTVWVEVNGTNFTVAVENGAASIVVSGLPEGSYALDVHYSGDEKYKSRSRVATFNVNKYKVAMKATAGSVRSGEDVGVNVVMSSDATGNVSIAVDSGVFSAEVIDGVASITVPGLADGTYTYDVLYGGDGKYKNCTSSVTFSVGD
ncbi:hypothetical protein TL18_02530 [Methanobrevibacter sp. YE315]|uniref:Ig-like domain-containing protein n=1 Tax=Methanobrevibacter sp. YE315 TaxID=1609968 RepID=UPI000764E11E|nr:Ig-like domain-containing protein [Methanobrevibacter sp. YE315]AMD16996.1 hypothetical protein TL18_02530 [Methanobrevibacter sp. YE315]